jgi:hypothetical protein
MKRLTLLLTAAVFAGCSMVPATTAAPGDLATRVAGTFAALTPAGPAASTEVPTAAAPTDTVPPPPTESATPTIPTFTPTVTVSPTVTLTPTTVAGDPRTTLGDPAYRDRFTNATNWTLGEDSFTRADIEDGQLVITGLTSTDGWRLTWPEIQDFYLEATFHTGTCTGNDHYGLMFRVPDRHAADNGYLFSLTCDGRYWLRRWDGEAMDTLVSLTANPAILQGSNQTNRVGVWADGSKIVLYANGKQLDELTDDSLKDEGGFGIVVGARKTEHFSVHVSEIAYWNLP